MFEESDFIKKLKIAVNKKLTISEVQSFIKLTPIINTLENNDKEIFKKIDIEITDGHKKKSPIFSEISNMMYWKVENKKIYVKVIGIWWDLKEMPHFFYGKIYAP